MTISVRVAFLFALVSAGAAPLVAGCSDGSGPSGADASTDRDARSDAPSDAIANVDAGAIACDGSACAGGEVCVVTTSGGGPCQMPDDAGVCPNGKPGTPGSCCDNTTVTAACQPLPAACNGVLSCPCASSLCMCGGCRLGDPGVLECGCFYP